VSNLKYVYVIFIVIIPMQLQLLQTIFARQPPGDNKHPKSSHLAMCTAACIGEKCLNVEKLVADKNEAIKNGHLLLSRLQNVSLLILV
jgi:hypothetical protein